MASCHQQRAVVRRRGLSNENSSSVQQSGINRRITMSAQQQWQRAAYRSNKRRKHDGIMAWHRRRRHIALNGDAYQHQQQRQTKNRNDKRSQHQQQRIWRLANNRWRSAYQ